MNLKEYLSTRKLRVDEALERLVPRVEGPAATVLAAMRYAVAGTAKRLRPILVMEACEACGGDAHDALDAGAAVEMIHTYSLIHDDLPAMDDDDLRRGRPTVHKTFGEAEAILAGDALLTLAFEVLATRPPGSDRAASRAEAVALAAVRAGARGMVGGQMADLDAERDPADAPRLRWIHGHKTGALFSASAEIGAIHAGASEECRQALASYGSAIGLAFQIADDILDRTGSAESLGKTPGKDERAGKTTYPSLFGVEASKERAEALVERARRALEPLGLLTDPLAALADHAVSRSR